MAGVNEQSPKQRIYFAYSRDDLRNAVKDVLNGLLSVPYSAQKYKIPESTLRDNVKKARQQLEPDGGVYTDISTVKEHKGRDKALCEELENQLKCYIEDCERIGLPQSPQRFSLDVQTYLKSQGIKSKYFPDDKPGGDYIKRLCQNDDGSTIRMIRPSQVKEEMNKNIDVEKWVPTLKEYVLDVQGEWFSDKGKIFVIESQTFKTYTNPFRQISVMVIYNGFGQIVQWIIVTDGSVLSEEFTIENTDTALFLKTSDGCLNSTTLRNAIIVTRRYVIQNKMEGDFMVFLDRFVVPDFDFCVWKYCAENCCYPMAVPRSVCSAIRTLNVENMSRYTSLMVFYIYSRYIALGFALDEREFTMVHQSVLHNLKPMAQINKVFGFLKLNCIVSRQRTFYVSEVEKNINEETGSMEVGHSAIVPSTSNFCVAKKKRRCSKAKIMVNVATQTGDDHDTNYIEAVNSVNELDIVDGEELFHLNHSDEVKGQLLITEIREEDFESDIEDVEKGSVAPTTSQNVCLSKLNKRKPGDKGLKKSK